jgi:predicted house-cleaning noncanonical NTP pyrophosphatase (MazG superfamily)
MIHRATRKKTKRKAASGRRRIRPSPQALLRRTGDDSPRSNFDDIRSEYGTKVAGLIIIPAVWTPAFVALPSWLYREWKLNAEKLDRLLRKHNVDLSKEIEALQLLGYSQIIVRSSAVGEDLDDRGRYISVVGADLTPASICKNIERVYRDFSRKHKRGNIGILIQGYIPSTLSGHLSNEVHLTPTRNQWKYEIERPTYVPHQGLNSKFSSSPSERLPLRRTTGERMSQTLRRVGHWINEHTEHRAHIEWCASDNRLWIVQFDIENETSTGIDPRVMPPIRPQPEKARDTATSSVFQLYDVAAPTSWRKLQNVKDFMIGSEATRHKLFFATGRQIKTALDEELGIHSLGASIDSLTNCRAVVRTDTNSEKISSFNMPRTNTVSGRNAALWIQRQISKFEGDSADLNEICFILHGYIPARAAAWSYYRPGSEIVDIDALWGLPDGLQFLPHDSVQCDTRSGAVLSEKIRYKDQFLQEQNDGSWRYVRVARQFGRARVLSQAALKEIALRTAAIGNKLNSDAQIMWFCDIPSELGIGSHLPWYRAKEIPNRLEVRRPPYRTIEVSEIKDLREIKSNESEKVILRLMPQADLVRNERFLDAVISIARKEALPVELAGSILGHAYYKLRAAEIVVYAAEPYAAYFRVRGRKVFRKLVRDQIPNKIISGGERAVQGRLLDRDIVVALLGKLFEEGLELTNATTDDNRAEELADIYEVWRALVSRSSKGVAEIEAIAEKKRAKRGGFDERLVLVETHLPNPASTQDGIERIVHLGEVGEISINKGTAIVPLTRLLMPRTGSSFVVKAAGTDIKVSMQLTSSGIELKLEGTPRDVTQFAFNFDRTKHTGLDMRLRRRTKTRSRKK